MDGEKTRILREEPTSKPSAPVKLVAGREVLIYTFRGYDIEKYVLEVEQKLSEKYDFIRGGGFKRERFFAFFDLSQASRIHRSIMEVKGDVEVSSSKMAIAGIVGEGMKYTKKIIERLGKALGDINIVYTLDISRISAGVVLNREDLKEALERLYASFIKA
jgi:aspartokinase